MVTWTYICSQAFPVQGSFSISKRFADTNMIIILLLDDAEKATIGSAIFKNSFVYLPLKSHLPDISTCMSDMKLHTFKVKPSDPQALLAASLPLMLTLFFQLLRPKIVVPVFASFTPTTEEAISESYPLYLFSQNTSRTQCLLTPWLHHLAPGHHHFSPGFLQ